MKLVIVYILVVFIIASCSVIKGSLNTEKDDKIEVNSLGNNESDINVSKEKILFLGFTIKQKMKINILS